MTPRRQLETLLGMGFGRRDLAKIMSTSVSAVELIARGERPIETIDVYRISQLDQLHRLVTQVFTRPGWVLGDVAAWFEAPIHLHCSYTPMDMYVDGKLALVLELAAGMDEPETILFEYDQNWERHTTRDLELYVGEDGHMSLQETQGDTA